LEKTLGDNGPLRSAGGRIGCWGGTYRTLLLNARVVGQKVFRTEKYGKWLNEKRPSIRIR